jgi:hypothetical protein
MTESHEKPAYLDKIGNFDAVEILVNEKKEIAFEGIIDPVYIQIHFKRVLKYARDYDIVKMVGYHGKKSKEVITEVVVGQ